MSWGGCIPWEVLVAECNLNNAYKSCAFVNEVRLWEMLDDYIY